VEQVESVIIAFLPFPKQLTPRPSKHFLPLSFKTQLILLKTFTAVKCAAFDRYGQENKIENFYSLFSSAKVYNRLSQC
jgi:hypothetical protein